jgi:hypothetical protein
MGNVEVNSKESAAQNLADSSWFLMSISGVYGHRPAVFRFRVAGEAQDDQDDSQGTNSQPSSVFPRECCQFDL